MHRNTLLIFIALIVSFSSFAEDKGRIGLTLDITTGGIFSHDLTELKVKSIVSNSPAEKAGIKVGQKIMSIDGCKIPGCSASKAEKLLKRKPGDILPLLIERNDGTQVLVKILVE